MPGAERIALNRNEDRKPERSKEYAATDRNEQEEIMAVRHDAVGVRGETGIVEGRDRVENAVPDGLKGVFTQGQETRNQHERNDRLNGEGSMGNALDDAADLAETADVQVFLRDELGAQAHLAADG